jgi:hypothetical protein
VRTTIDQEVKLKRFLCFLIYMSSSTIKIKNIAARKGQPLYEHFQSKENITNLICLYQASHLECSRSRGLTPEVGSSRERDLIASFCNNKSLDVNYNISNENEEDVIIDNKKISIKHSSNKTVNQRGIKIIWTVDSNKREHFINNHTFTCDMLIVYVRFEEELDQGELEIVYLPAELLEKHRSDKMFKCLEGNSRGIEFQKDAFNTVVKEALFHIQIKFSNMECELKDPVAKRVTLLKSLGDGSPV